MHIRGSFLCRIHRRDTVQVTRVPNPHAPQGPRQFNPMNRGPQDPPASRHIALYPGTSSKFSSIGLVCQSFLPFPTPLWFTLSRVLPLPLGPLPLPLPVTHPSPGRRCYHQFGRARASLRLSLTLALSPLLRPSRLRLLFPLDRSSHHQSIFFETFGRRFLRSSTPTPSLGSCSRFAYHQF